MRGRRRPLLSSPRGPPEFAEPVNGRDWQFITADSHTAERGPAPPPPAAASVFSAASGLPSFLGGELNCRKSFYHPQLSPTALPAALLQTLKPDPSPAGGGGSGGTNHPSRPSFSIDNIIGGAVPPPPSTNPSVAPAAPYPAGQAGPPAQVLAVLSPALAPAQPQVSLAHEPLLQPAQNFSSKITTLSSCHF